MFRRRLATEVHDVNGVRVQTTLFDLVDALQSVCDDDREVVVTLASWLSRGRGVGFGSRSLRLVPGGATPCERRTPSRG